MADELDTTLCKLKECGCRKDLIDEYEQLQEKETKTETIQSFQKYKKELMGKLDEDCKSIDCIDYLIYEIEKKK